MLTENLQIYRDCDELVKALAKSSDNVPKMVRYNLLERAMSMSLEAMDMIYVANSDYKERPAALARMLQLIGGIRSRVRIMGDLHCLPPKRTTYLMLVIGKISKQAIGWRNASQGQNR